MKNIKLTLALLLLQLLAVSSYGQRTLHNSVKFLQEAATLGMNAEALANLGQKQLENPEAKAYVLEVLNHQMVANAQLKSLAKKKKVKLPEPMSIPINSMQTRVDTSDFDKEYLQMMIEDQKKAITLYESGSKSSDREIKSYASRYLAIYRKNLQGALKLNQAQPPK